MDSKYFWQVPQLKRFRVIFEDADILVGASDENQFQAFRQDNPYIKFSEKEAREAARDFEVAVETSLVIMLECLS